MSEFLCKNDSQNLVQDQTCFKNLDNPSSIDLFITNHTSSFQYTTTLATDLFNFHRMILTVLKSTCLKVKTKEIIYRNLKNFNLKSFKNYTRTNIKSVENYDAFEKGFLKGLNYQ